MRTFLRSMMILGAVAPALACAVQSGEGMESTTEALCKDPPCGNPPPPPPPKVSPPDVSFEMATCLKAEQETVLVGALKTAFPQAADVLPSCSGGNERVGIWVAPESGADDLAARERGLPTVNILQPGELFAGNVSGPFLMRTAYAAWNASPKVRNGNGKPDPNGSLHLTGFDVDVAAPTHWISRVHGTDTTPWPDVDFTLTTTDTIGVANGRITCSSQNALDTDTGLLDVLTAVYFFSPLGDFFLIEDILASSADAPSSTSGSILCPAAKVFPAQILLPGTRYKATFEYTRAQADGNGITVGGSMAIVPRTPAASIDGPTSITVGSGSRDATGAYVASTTDLRTPLHYEWSATGAILAPTASSTTIRFALTGREPDGTSVPESVHLHVVDADNTVIDVDRAVTVGVVQSDPWPPICRVKPWLPQCQ